MDCCPITARKVGEVVYKRAQTFDEKTKLPKEQPTARAVSPLQWKDLEVGTLLGKGSFSSVYNVQIIKNHQQHQKDYALKILQRQVIVGRVEEDSFETGAVGLVMEAKFLERLCHPNIIRLHGKKNGSLLHSFTTSGYFLVLERLYGTLDERMQVWKEEIKSQKQTFAVNRLLCISRTSSDMSSSSVNKLWQEGNRNKHAAYRVPSLLERLDTIALAVANAMEYLHRHKICFRDLKARNVGLAADGSVRLFDFGLALELHDSTDDESQPQEQLLSGNVGTTRYMAPENALCKPYGLPCDVYSFGLVLWEIVTLKVAYKKLTPTEHWEQVVTGNERPSLTKKAFLEDEYVSSQLKILMQACWHASPACRPTFATIGKRLQAEVNLLAKPALLLQQRRIKPPSPSRKESKVRVSSLPAALDTTKKVPSWIGSTSTTTPPRKNK